jgi:hypothetical protein
MKPLRMQHAPVGKKIPPGAAEWIGLSSILPCISRQLSENERRVTDLRASFDSAFALLCCCLDYKGRRVEVKSADWFDALVDSQYLREEPEVSNSIPGTCSPQGQVVFALTSSRLCDP